MHGQPKLIGLAPELAVAIGERQAEQRHAFFLPGSRSSSDVGFPVNQPSGFECRAMECFAFREFCDFALQRGLGLEKLAVHLRTAIGQGFGVRGRNCGRLFAIAVVRNH